MAQFGQLSLLIVIFSSSILHVLLLIYHIFNLCGYSLGAATRGAAGQDEPVHPGRGREDGDVAGPLCPHQPRLETQSGQREISHRPKVFPYENSGLLVVHQTSGQCCGSKYIEFGSGSRILAQFGSGSSVIQSILKEKI